jgi:aldehyde:ferredoxin oxidoreductase
MAFGYHGRYLRIDATIGTAEPVPLDESTLRRYLGGVGLAAHVVTTECPPGVDPLAPANPLAFVFSPLVGTPLTTSAKFAVAAKSPLTDRFCDALASSRFALAGKRTGFDAIVIRGKCDAPSVLLIDEGIVRIEPADDVWGKTIPEAEAHLATRYGPDWAFAVIGPAGEHLVRFATISHDGRHAGRGGLGSILGSKRIKAVGVRGNIRAPVADPAGVVAAAKALSAQSFGPATAKYRELGTVANLLAFNRLNALPTRNFTAGQFDGAEAISGEALAAAHKVIRSSCAGCTIGCEHGFIHGDQTVRLEYESLFALGPLCGIADRDTILQAAKRCDDLGLDTISAGATVAFAMECGERGLLEDPSPNPSPMRGGEQNSPPSRFGKGIGGLGDISLRFGRGETLLSLLDRIARRDGLGDLLAEGTRRASAAIGGNAPTFAPHVKGLEIPGYEPRALQAMALGFAVGSRGADHNRSGAYEADFSAAADRLHGDEHSAALAVETEDRAALVDSLILCKFLRGVFTDLYAESAELLRLVTGWDVTADELKATAKWIVTAKKWFNEREGWTPEEDTLPERFLSEGLPAGTAPGATLPRERLRAMIAAYYRERGWNEDGTVSLSARAVSG